MDAGQQEYYIEKQQEADRIEKILFRLHIAEAFYSAYVGGQYDKAGNNRQSYQSWRDALIDSLLPEEERIKHETFWQRKDSVKKKTGKRSFKIL